MGNETMSTVVDLIYVEYRNGRTMSCAIIGEGKDKLLGPVPGKESVKALAALLATELPDRFPTTKSAEEHLMFVHFRNITLHRNSAGQDYPFKIDADVPA